MTSETEAQQPAAATAPAKNTLGLIALILAGVGFLVAVIPATAGLAWLLTLPALILGIVGVTRKGQRKGTSIAAIALATIAWITAVIVATAAVIGTVNSPAEDADGAPPVSEVEGEPSEEAPAEDASASGWADETYGSFDPITESGSGDSIVALPEGVDAALVTATHDGSSNFAVQVIDEENQPTLDLLVNTIGNYEGTRAYGLNGSFGGVGTNLKVSADGAWTITIAPLSTAPALPESGEGDGVFLYSGGPATLALTHDGESNFSVSEYTDEAFNMGLLVNEIGTYEGTVPLSGGPSVITISADGSWTSTLG